MDTRQPSHFLAGHHRRRQTSSLGSVPLPAPDMSRLPARRIAVWLPLCLLALVLLGSLVLVTLFQRFANREDRAAFLALAQANAAFLRHSTLPRSEKMASQLSQLLSVSVWFQSGSDHAGQPPQGLPLPFPADAETHTLQGLRVIGIPLDTAEGTPAAIFFARPSQPVATVFRRTDTWLALGTFWALTAVFGMLIARWVTRPLGQLAQAVPLLAAEQPLPALPTERSDEIGELARSFHSTHQTLATERDRRAQAERLALLGQMAAGLAHEVRNPLAAIRLHAQLLEGATDVERQQSQNLIESEATRIESLVSQWLHLARPSPPVLTPVDLTRLMEHTCRLLQPQAVHAAVSLKIAAAQDARAAIVMGDRDRLHQAFANVILNALQATPAGGAVRLLLHREQSRFALTVEDTGPGFSTSALEKGGQAFFSEREGGMGLGLAVALDICRAHGGDLEWSNREDGPGARVTLQLPAPA